MSSINNLSANNEKELSTLISFGAVDAVLDLISQGDIDVNFVDNYGSTPLVNACYYDLGFEVIKTLLQAGANPNISNKNGGTPLSVALICKNDISVIKELIAAGANVNAQTNCGSSPIIFAVRNKNPPNVILLLLQSGANVNVSIKAESSNFFGFTALHFAAFESQEEAARLLVRFGANVNIASTKFKKSPLDIASSEMRSLIVKERDIREKKQQAILAITKIKKTSTSVMETIKQKNSTLLRKETSSRIVESICEQPDHMV